ncbi:MAG TPA: 2-hydroxychromene-2-carboxylate isomerase [Xanthobacteraceae bacterium]|nr:2-hydroxychromene-2-carboxylate isomerase [Xanthobacteraceae bacterium]
MAVPPIEVWFDFASNYSYLSVMRLEDAACRHGVRVVWQPFFLGPILRDLGFAMPKQKLAHVWRDMARQTGKYGLPWTQPSAFPRLSVLPARVALLGVGEPWIGAFCRGVMALNWVRDADINAPENLAPILTELGLAAADLLARAQADPAKAQLRAQTEAARARGIFGAPTFFVGTEMFWGDDRLDDALALAAQGVAGAAYA